MRGMPMYLPPSMETRQEVGLTLSLAARGGAVQSYPLESRCGGGRLGQLEAESARRVAAAPCEGRSHAEVVAALPTQGQSAT